MYEIRFKSVQTVSLYAITFVPFLSNVTMQSDVQHDNLECFRFFPFTSLVIHCQKQHNFVSDHWMTALKFVFELLPCRSGSARDHINSAVVL